MDKKRTICLVLALIMLLGLVALPLQALAAEAPTLTDAGFEGDLWNDKVWSVWFPDGEDWTGKTVENLSYADDSYLTVPAEGGSKYVKVYMENGGNAYITQELTNAPAGTYTVTAQSMGDGGETVAVVLGDQKGTTVQTDVGYNNWTASSGTFTINQDCEKLIVGLYITCAAGSWCSMDNLTLTYEAPAEAPTEEPTEEPTEAPAEPGTPEVSEKPVIALANGNFEQGDSSNWTLTGYSEVATDEWAANNNSYALSLWLSDSEAASGSASYTIKLKPGTYHFTFDLSGAAMDSGLRYSITAGETVLAQDDSTYTTGGWDSWQTVTTSEFTLTEATEIAFTLSGTQPAGYFGDLDNLTLYGTGGIALDFSELKLENADFELGDSTNWTLTGYSEVATDQWAANNNTYALSLWLSDSEAASGSASYPMTLSAGTYYLSFDLSGAAMDSGLRYSITAGETVLAKGDTTCTTGGWDVWSTETTAEFTLSEETDITFTLSGTQPAGYFGDLDNLTLYGTGTVVNKEPEIPPVEADIYVPKISGTGGDFMRGMDVSSLQSVLNSGATFKDWDGNELNGQGFMNLLAESGTNWIRLRVWNNPFDASGNGYGGGNNDLAAAVTMGKWATNAGMKVLIDFHYSDFWADPGKQQAPKAWAGYTLEQKAAALEEYTYNSLKTLLDAGVNVGMVQVGNETTGKICGESGWANMCTLFSAGSKAIRQISSEYNTGILVAIHFTNPERAGSYASIAKQLDTYEVDYDVFASSYYPYWHGTLDNLTSVLKTVANTYDKYVIVAETSWAYTLEDGDGHDNTVRKNNNDSESYSFSVQGQADEIAAVTKAVRNVGDKGIGIFYWEPAWIPVQVYDGTEETLNENKALWEKYGAGWASSYAAEYDPNDAGVWYGGSAWDNQALFDFEGNPLASLKTYSYMQSGTTGFDIIVTGVESPSLNYTIGDTLALPETLTVDFNVGASEDKAVTWNADDVAAVDMNTPGTYTIRGTVDGGIDATCTVIVKGENLLLNPSMEESDMSMYTSSQAYAKRTTDDPYAGSYSLHFYNSGVVDFTTEQTVTLKPGHYTFSLYGQGGDVGEDAETYIYVKAGETLTEAFALTGWAIWANPTIEFDVTEEMSVTVGVNVTASQNGSWGTFDEWYLCENTAPAHSGGEATCTEKAVCESCGESYGELDSTNHGETEIRDAKEATETTEGYTGDTYCVDCGELVTKGEVIPVKEHVHLLTKISAIEATEETEGNIEYYVCACGKLFSDAEGKNEITAADTVVPKLEHKHELKKTAAKKATETAEGNIEYYTCTKCGKIYKDADATKEITKADTVIPKIDDNANTADGPITMFVILMTLSLAGIVILGKRKFI